MKTDNMTLDNAVGGLTPELGHTPERHDSIMQRIKNAAMSKYIALALLATTPALESCTDKGVEPIEQVDPNKLTAEEEAFAKLLAPHPDGTPKYSILEGGVEPYVFKNFARVELKLLNAKGMQYEATPVIQKKSVADVLAKAKELNPDRPRYYVSLSLVKKSGGTETVLNGTVFVAEKDDNNPSTRSPWLDVLPEEFTMDEFNKHNEFASVPKSYTLNSGEEMVVRIYVGGEGIISNFNFGVNPVTKVN